ncbi:hypothetical protein GJW-30_1_03028 [Variibacter gotjawalensis]|uniref:Uncharacterized protein n=1 Tax=Variibacter gotjawalensis TaxID=1333996 RepID=A0A0S3PX75_9BRAD|nr:hypothetical protein [Variibacter gotjawalensis]RZS48227.1 hypothetical protein EV661_0631 [Variibacter gotjawalensis]BAT60484.1 hypothetical protein GJW-30_1_03028 [Variibacter gotjawalensis]
MVSPARARAGLKTSQFIEDKQWLCFVFEKKSDAEAMLAAFGGDGFLPNRPEWLKA